MEGIDRAKCAIIVTEKPDEICKALSEAFGSPLQQPAQLFHVWVAGHDGVVMNGHMHPIFLPDVTLDIIDQVMAFQHIAFGGHFHMKHRKAAARAVIMHHQIMHPQHARIAAHGVLNVLHKGRVGRFPQQCAERIPHHADAAV